MQKVSYKKWIGIFLIACGAFLLLSTFMLGNYLNAFTGSVGILFGSLYLAKPVIEYNDEEINIKNVFGKTMKQVLVKTDKIEIRDGVPYANDKKIFPGYKSLNADEYGKLLSHIEAIKK